MGIFDGIVWKHEREQVFSENRFWDASREAVLFNFWVINLWRRRKEKQHQVFADDAFFEDLADFETALTRHRLANQRKRGFRGTKGSGLYVLKTLL